MGDNFHSQMVYLGNHNIVSLMITYRIVNAIQPFRHSVQSQLLKLKRLGIGILFFSKDDEIITQCGKTQDTVKKIELTKDL